ncbi:MAG: chitobiase/beta-hexosaminidase C-terminal domain-containing protein [Prevotella sp.]|nr:chitobiase/beta-hexosaminidase C-terminal domain-containing protein [Prevotella sp.]
MKKILSLMALLLTFAVGAYAQDDELRDDFSTDGTYKKSWDFTQGFSDETKENLAADKTNWADNGTDADGNVNNWKNAVKQDASKFWKANGHVIPELLDLKIDIGSNKDNSIHLAANNIRLTRKGTKITFPQLKNGQKITIQGRSANGTATNRGIAPVQSYIQFLADESSAQTDGACIFVGGSVEGSEGTYTFKWIVNNPNVDNETRQDVQFQLTPDAGIMFYLFQIDEGDSPAVEEAQPVAYLYSGDLDSDYAHIYLSGDERFAFEDINVDATEETAATLRGKLEDGKTNRFKGVVISPTIGADHPFLAEIKKLVAFIPVLNLNPNLYEALGYGSAVPTEATFLTLPDPENPHEVFEGLDATEGIELLAEGGITGVELGDYFADDEVIAIAGNAVAMHIHNPKRNAYMLLPLTIEDMAVANQDIIATLIPNVLQSVLSTRQDERAVGTPVITPTQENGYTTVTITAANSKKIYYTTDGSDPTTESTVYTEALSFTAPATVKAFATGDGYNDSQIASKDIIIMVQAATPQFDVAREAGKSTITISGASEGATVYYNYTGSTVDTESVIYTEPIVLTQPTTIYAFAKGGDYLTSEVGQQFVGINGIDKNTIRWDVLAHFDANADNWKGKGQQTDADGNITNANYFFTWGKDAGQYWDETSDKVQKKDEEGNPVYEKDEEGNDILDQPVMVYSKTLAPETYEADGWRIKSIGQVMVWESLDTKYNIGDGSYRNPDAAEDVIGVNDEMGFTRDALTFGKQPSGGPFNASLETVDKYQAPFDIVIYAGNGNDGEIPTMQVEVSADGENWTKVGDVAYSLVKRCWKKTHLSYEGNDQVYVRILHTAAKSSGQIYDLYLMNNGEKSQQYDEATMAGVSEVKADQRSKVAGIYSINGIRLQQLQRGLNIVVGADGKVRKVMVK